MHLRTRLALARFARQSQLCGASTVGPASLNAVGHPTASPLAPVRHSGPTICGVV